MKKIYLLALLFMTAGYLNAQYVYNDYDANQNENFLGWENMPVLIANPDPTGVNTSANVAQWDRTGQQYSNIWADLSGTVDFTTGTVFSMKVWSPIACDVLFKLEDGGGGFAERLQSISTPNQWVQLDFDFTGEASGVYNKVVFFLDFASFNSNTFYFDDIQGPHHSGSLVKPLLAADVQDNFENNGWGNIDNWIFQDPGLVPLTTTADPVNASNTVADYYRSGSSQWTNAQTVLAHRMDLSMRNVFELKVYLPSSNDYTGALDNTVAIKLQNSLLGGNAWTTQAAIVHTVNDFDQWVTLTFDYSGWSTTEDYDKIVIQFGGEGHWEVGQFYFDDLELLPLTPPYTYNDFDTAQHVPFGGWPNLPVTILNPDVSGINTSDSVAEWVRGTEQWAHMSSILEGPVNFGTASNFQLKVHSPILCNVLFKLQDHTNPAIFVEKMMPVQVTNEWTLLNFDFSGAPSETYDMIVIFFDFASFDDNTFYVDDIIGPEYDGPKPILDLDVQDNFENDGWSTIDYWLLQDPGLDTMTTTADPVNGSNNVADYTRSGNFEYTNAQTILNHRLDLSERNKFEIDVYFPSSNDYTGSLAPTAALKLQNSKMGGSAWMTQTEIVHTIATFDEWQTLLFDFSAIADSINYDQLVVQLGGEAHWAPGQFYFDNFYLKHVPFITVQDPNGGEQIDQGSSYEISWDYGWWEGDIKIELIREGQNPQLIVYNIPAADSTYTWNVMPGQEPADDYRVIITSLTDDFPTDTSDAYFTILEVTALQANFAADLTLIAEGDSVLFTDFSTGSPDSWEWTFEGGMPETYSGQQPPYIKYETAGTYDVTLEISGGGNSDVMLMEDYITVGMVPTADFEGTPTALYAGESVDFTSLATGENLSFEWFFEGGNPATSMEENPSGIVYDTPGLFDVKLIVTNEFGVDSLTRIDYIDAMPVGIEEYSKDAFHIYPNPTRDNINIQFGKQGKYEIQLSSLNGVLIQKYQVNEQETSISTAALQAGIYVVRAINLNAGESFIRKLVIIE
jgi:PKD repeat protein